MKKNFLILFLLALLICGCERKVEDIVTDSEFQNIVDDTEKPTNPNFIDGFENPEYKKFNSYASENGLSDAPIYIEGKVLNQTKIGDSEPPILSMVVEQEDGNRWCVSIISDSKIDKIQDKNIRAFGIYSGYSDVFNLPAMLIFTDDEKMIDKLRIEIQEEDQYVTAWSLLEYTIKLASDIQENEKNDNNIIDESDEALEKQLIEKSEAAIPTTGELNALKTAKNYLSFMTFSYDGLINQLEYEQYSHDEALYAANNCGANWNEQAEKKAKQYLKSSSFSKDRLIEQLEYEGFTHEQAIYGVEQNGY